MGAIMREHNHYKDRFLVRKEVFCTFMMSLSFSMFLSAVIINNHGWSHQAFLLIASLLFLLVVAVSMSWIHSLTYHRRAERKIQEWIKAGQQKEIVIEKEELKSKQRKDSSSLQKDPSRYSVHSNPS